MQRAERFFFDGVDAEKKMQDIFYFESVEWLDKNLSGLDLSRFVRTHGNPM